MTALGDEIAAAKVEHGRKLARLRERERRKQVRLDTRVLALLRDRIRSDDLSAIEDQALRELAAERAARSARARTSQVRDDAGHQQGGTR